MGVQCQPSSLSTPVSSLSSKLMLSMDKTTSAVENVIISPVSIFLALSLLYHGSDRSTKAELENFLEIRSRIGSAVATKALLSDYDRSRKTLNTTIKLANGIFADHSLRIKTPFLDDLRYLSSGVRRVDFSDRTPAARAVNSWVGKETNNLITNLISPDDISEDTRMVLLNAVYFKANWKSQFYKDRTRKSVRFDVTRGYSVLVEMMVFLPHHQDQESLLSIIQQFPNTDFNSVYNSLRVRPVDLSLPKFTVDFKSELVSALKRNGVMSMFNPDQADF